MSLECAVRKCRIASCLVAGVLTCLFVDQSEAFQTQNVGYQYSVTRLQSDLLSENDIEIKHLEKVKRIFCISDLHTDHIGNMEWLDAKCSEPDEALPMKDDLLIIAGDISHEFSKFSETIQILQKLDCHLFFVPGNHEAWVRSDDDRCDSLEKLQAIDTLCAKMGVYTGEICVGQASKHPLWVLPLHGWYDGTLTIEGCAEFCEGFGFWPWTDFMRCKWPSQYPPIDRHEENGRIPLGLVEYFIEMNKSSVDTVQNALLSMSGDNSRTGVMTVSHFLPNSQCLPDWKDVESPTFLRDEWFDHGAPDISAKFAKVAGSSLLDDQIRSVVPSGRTERHLHVFGHSHRPKDFEFDGIRYVHNPLGKPREREMHMVDPNVDFQLMWDTSTGEVAGKQIIRYWDEYGGGVTALRERMKARRPHRYNKKYGKAQTAAEKKARSQKHASE
mmetsp:Transcript_22698/g.31694  ORF Transcript_22698/g.31694 Transcript_22698/m.31694 type:complete len:443 (+) Transcript_22698:76-1404(+)